MSDNPNHQPDPGADESAPGSVDRRRRRIAALGAGGTAALLSVTSRSAVAGWGTCTGSELASGNLSRAATANPCGCSPGYWWNPEGSRLWSSVPALYSTYPRTARFNTVFGRPFFKNADVTLADVGPSTTHENNYNANDNTAMHAVAALLNAHYYGARYPVLGMQTASSVILAFQSACGLLPADRKGALAAFVATVDIYGRTPSLWCNGSPERSSGA